MAKTKEELNELKQECESLASKLQELTDDELMQVTGGTKATLSILSSVATLEAYAEWRLAAARR